MKGKNMVLASAAVIALAAPWSAIAAPGASASPSTPVVQQLEEAAIADRMESMSHSSDNPSLDGFYADKAEEVGAVLGRIKSGENVSEQEIKKALDNSGARQL